MLANNLVPVDEADEVNSGDNLTNKIPDNPSVIGHIFRDVEGHLPDTLENRTLLTNVANNPNLKIGQDQYGTTWYAQLNDDGTQTWVQARNGIIFQGGINQVPRPWDPETDLSAPQPPRTGVNTNGINN